MSHIKVDFQYSGITEDDILEHSEVVEAINKELEEKKLRWKRICWMATFTY